MTMNRVQFQPGLSMAEFMDRYGSEESCEAALIESRWPEGFACPSCGGGHSSSFRREGRLYFQCTACRHQCSVISGTVFEATKLPLSGWFLAMHLLTQSKNNVAALELQRHLGVCYKTAWLMKHKLMEVMREREDSRQLQGRVEIDDAYLGGERTGGKVGRGSENKIPFVVAVQTTPEGKPQFVCLRQQPFTHEEVAVFAARSIAPTATVVSDGLWCFGADQSVGAQHQFILRAVPLLSSRKSSAGVPVIETLCGACVRAAVRFLRSVALIVSLILSSAALASQDAEVDVRVRIVDDVVFVDVDCFVRATPEEAWLVLTDYDNATRFISKLERSVSTTTASGLVLVSQKGTMGFGPFSVPLETVMEMRLTPVEKIQARLISGTLKKYEAVTTLLRDPLGTRLTHRSEAIPDVWIPPVIGQAMVSYEAKERFGQLLAEILRRKGRPDATR